MKNKILEAVGIFDNFNNMEDAIAELEVSGFNRLEISVLGNESALRKAFGKRTPSTERLESSTKTPRSTNISREELGIAQGVLIAGGLVLGLSVVGLVIMSGGTLSSDVTKCFFIGGVLGASLGGFLAKYLGDKYVIFFRKQIDNGGLLLWVRTKNKAKEQIARRIFRKYDAHGVHIQQIA